MYDIKPITLDSVYFVFPQITQVPFHPVLYPEQEMIQRSEEFYQEMNHRRSVRFFSEKPIPKQVIENIIRTAGKNWSSYHHRNSQSVLLFSRFWLELFIYLTIHSPLVPAQLNSQLLISVYNSPNFVNQLSVSIKMF